MNNFEAVARELNNLLNEWEPIFANIDQSILENRRNSQNRTIKQIVGHMIDSASNNTHRVIHLQYQPSPLQYPDYANLGINDKWIAIQKFQDEDWDLLVKMWNFSNKHFIHVINNVDMNAIDNVWISALDEQVTLREMIIDYPRHLKLHIEEIVELLNAN